MNRPLVKPITTARAFYDKDESYATFPINLAGLWIKCWFAVPDMGGMPYVP
jgi:hypothetical protein